MNKKTNKQLDICGVLLSFIKWSAVCAASPWPQLQGGGAGREAAEAGGDVPVGGVPGQQVSLFVYIQCDVRSRNTRYRA